MELSSITPLIQAGGVIAFAALVYLQLRAFGTRLDEHARVEQELLADTKTLLTLLLERERMRGGTPATGYPIHAVPDLKPPKR